MSDRNRAEGWQHAKLTGHKNEELVAKLTESDVSIQKRLLDCAHIPSNVIISKVEYGGLCESDVDCVLDGGKTKSKTDMWLYLSNGKRLNVSIKKDDGGQVYLISIDRFIRGFEVQFNKKIPNDVKRAISLYFGSAEDTLQIINQFASKNKALETRKHRLVAETLKAYDTALYSALLKWVNDNIGELFDFCFSKGLAKNPSDWADIVWYINLIGENDFDTMINLSELRNKVPTSAEYGTKNGGSTIQLPFGFVQWHSPRKIIPGNIQFHHNYNKILDLID
ncbi:MAG: hypothetical protein IKH65_01570 [Clostridia bacterium]|nr:hypothetical protein [Clostridia bacterium]